MVSCTKVALLKILLTQTYDILQYTIWAKEEEVFSSLLSASVLE